MKFPVMCIVLAAASAPAVAPALAQDATVERSGGRVVVSVPVSPAQEPQDDLEEIVGARFPLSVAFSELGAGWRELSYQGQPYFTKGDTAYLSGERHMVAYKYDPSLVEDKIASERELIGRLLGAGRSFEPGDRFAITFLPARAVENYISGGQTNLRSFSASKFRVPFDPPLESSAFRQNLTVLYLSQIAQAASAYSSKYLNVTPPLETAFAARQALLPFVPSERVFLVPGTNVPFKANPILGNRKREHLRRRRNAVMFYQASPAEDGLRAVLLLSGQVRRVDEKAWARLRKDSLLD